MRYISKKIVFCICMLLIVSSAIACSKKSDATNAASDNTQNSSTIYGKVTKVDGDKITLALGEMPHGRMGGNNPSGMPMPDDKNGGPNSSNVPNDNSQNDNSSSKGQSKENGKNNDSTTKDTQKNNSEKGGPAPSGMPKDGKPGDGQNRGMGGAFTESGETKEITIADESLIKLQSRGEETQGSLKDITVDSILTIEYSNDNKITAIIVSKFNFPKQNTDNSKNTDSSK